MDNKSNSYHIVELSAERRGMAAYQELKSGKHCMYALLEVDVTLARKFIADYKAMMGEQLSFTGYLVSCLARAVDEDKTVQAYRKGSKQLVVFDDVDVGFMIELKKEEKRLLRGYVVKAANRKTYAQIQQEIRTVQSNKTPTDSEQVARFRRLMLLPWPLSSFFKASFCFALRRDPTIATSMAGTVGISSVGMFGKGHAGWGIANGSHGLDVVVGGIAPRLAEVDGKIETRQMLSLTIIFDHDILDGAPAARFTRRFIELIESGYGLEAFNGKLSAVSVQSPVVHQDNSPDRNN